MTTWKGGPCVFLIPDVEKTAFLRANLFSQPNKLLLPVCGLRRPCTGLTKRRKNCHFQGYKTIHLRRWCYGMGFFPSFIWIGSSVFVIFNRTRATAEISQNILLI